MKSLSAIAGGVGVAMTFLVARQTMENNVRAVVAAVTLMGLMGYWFHSTATELHALHAACASVLLLGLLRAFNCKEDLDPLTGLLCAAGTLLVPISHTSGYFAAVPIVYVLWRLHLRAERRLFERPRGDGGEAPRDPE